MIFQDKNVYCRLYAISTFYGFWVHTKYRCENRVSYGLKARWNRLRMLQKVVQSRCVEILLRRRLLANLSTEIWTNFVKYSLSDIFDISFLGRKVNRGRQAFSPFFGQITAKMIPKIIFMVFFMHTICLMRVVAVLFGNEIFLPWTLSLMVV